MKAQSDAESTGVPVLMGPVSESGRTARPRMSLKWSLGKTLLETALSQVGECTVPYEQIPARV